MRSEVIFRASESIENKYQLCQTVSQATRRVHIANQDVNQTINTVFITIAANGHPRSLAQAS